MTSAGNAHQLNHIKVRIRAQLCFSLVKPLWVLPSLINYNAQKTDRLVGCNLWAVLNENLPLHVTHRIAGEDHPVLY